MYPNVINHKKYKKNKLQGKIRKSTQNLKVFRILFITFFLLSKSILSDWPKACTNE